MQPERRTVGWGATFIDGAPEDTETTVTPEQPEGLLRHEVSRTGKAIGNLITTEVTENMFSALYSWTTNLGTVVLATACGTKWWK